MAIHTSLVYPSRPYYNQVTAKEQCQQWSDTQKNDAADSILKEKLKQHAQWIS